MRSTLLDDLLNDEPQDLDVLYQVAIGVRESMERMSGGRLVSDMKLPGKIDSQLEWGRAFLPDHFLLSPSAMHRWIAEKCDESRRRRGMKINLIGPRGGAKSTNATLAFPLRCALEGWEPLIWIISETKEQACEHLENIKIEIESNEMLTHAYPRSAGRGPLWRSERIRLSNGVGIVACSVGQKLRGRRQRASRPTLIICDDIQSDAVMTSVNRRIKDRDWFRGVVLKAGTSRTNIFNLSTALHRDALGSELERTPGWESKTFPAIIEWPTYMHLWAKWSDIYCDMDDPDHEEKARDFFSQNKVKMIAGAKVLWPEQEDLYTLMCMREEGGKTTFEREKQGRPVNAEQCEWPDEYFEGDIWFDDFPADADIRVMTLDPSKGKDAKRSDYSACVMVQKTRTTLYVDADLQRRPTSQMVQDCLAHYRLFQPHAFGVESNQYQELLAVEFEREFQRLGLLDCSPYQIVNTINKLVRIRTLGPYLSQHRIRFRRNSPGARLLVDQLREFPDPHAHDDGPDALEMAITLAGKLLAEAN